MDKSCWNCKDVTLGCKDHLAIYGEGCELWRPGNLFGCKNTHGMLILADIQAERIRQDEKWGEQNNHPLVWISVLTEEVGELAQAVLKWQFEHGGTLTEVRNEAIHCAAVAQAFIECLDRDKWER